MYNIVYKIIICILIGSVTMSGFAQSTLPISGKVVNSKTNEGIPFANMIIESTFTGGVSDENGNFNLKVPKKHLDKRLKISAIGFNTTYQSLSDLKPDGKFEIKLQPSSYSLKNVEIVGTSRLQQTRIRRVVDHIEKNYPQGALNYEFYFKNSENNDKKVFETVGIYYDSKGYSYSNPLNTFKERNYSFKFTRKNFTTKTFSDHMHLLDDVLAMDIVRSGTNILDKNFLHLYDLDLEKTIQLSGDSVWVITYKNKTPTLCTTGDYYATSYSGKLYIKIKDYAVLKNELEVKSTDYSRFGRGYHTAIADQPTPVSVAYRVVTNYKKTSESYVLDNIRLTRKFTYKDKVKKSESDFFVTKVETTQPEKITSRTYFTNLPYDEMFWNTFQLPF